MAPSRRKSASKAAAAAAARRQWKVGDLVLAKVKGFPAWPATVSEPKKWGYSSDWKKVLVYFFGTQQIAFCNPADVEAFTEEKKQSLMGKRQGKGADFVRAVQEIVESYEKLKKQNQVDDSKNDGAVALPKDGNSSDSPGSKELTDASEAMLDLGSKTTSTMEITDLSRQNDDTLAVDKIENLHEKESESQPVDNVSVKEAPVLTTYSSRKRSGGTRSQKSVVERKSPLIRRARNSSRLESSRSLAPMVLCNDGGRSGRDISASISMNGSLRRSNRVRKSPDATESDEVDVSPFESNGTVEDDGSEIATVDSDTLSLNEGSAIDSGSKSEHSEALEFFDGDVELSKALDFQMKAVVIKKKRKPNRKRMTNDFAEASVKIDSEAGLEMEVQNTTEKLQSACTNPVDQYRKEDRDKHLPLVKRARVRMSGPSSAEQGLTSSSQTEEKPSCEGAASLSDQINPLSNCQDDNSADRDSFRMEGASVNVFPSNCDIQALGNRLRNWKGMRNQFNCSADGEATLPPSKRLHRALEAMSANAAEEDQVPSETSPSMKTVVNASRGSPINSQMIVEEKEVIGLGKAIISHMEIEKCNQSHRTPGSPSNEASENVVTEPVNPVGSSSNGVHQCESSFDIHNPNIQTSVQNQNLEKLAPNADRNEHIFRASDSLLDQQLPRENGGSLNVNPSNYGDDNTSEELDTSEHAKICQIPVPQADLSVKVLPHLQHAIEHADCEKLEPLKLQIEDGSIVGHMDEDVTDVQHKERHRSSSGLTSVCNSSDKNVSGFRLSPSSVDRVDSSARISPSNTSVCRTSTSESADLIQSNDCCSPNVPSGDDKALYGLIADDEVKTDSLASERSKSINKCASYSEAQAALSSFENVLGTLTRTKESIGRATRIAIDCAKFGASAKVVDIVARCLECESSLHKRVDLFFLVDSITQCSRGLKGDVGGLYPSAIQTLLPRLLSAAAPPGPVAQENRRQCLKVLRVWLERRILPESIVRQHIRELDSHGASSTAGPFSRHSARTERTERALDDPIRDMEGMLVDEYGSNSSFQLPGFRMPCMFKDEDEGSDSDGGSFEAVTPEHCSGIPDEQEMTPAIEKRRHILEDVDGELEMEDVAPREEINLTSVTGVDTAETSEVQSENPLLLPFAPPLPQDVPPSSPPLPSSPPPIRPQPPQLLPPLPVQPPSVTSNHYTNCVDSKAYVSMHDRRDDFQQPSVAARGNSTMCSSAMPYHGPESRDVPISMHASDRNGPLNPYPVHPVNDMQQNGGPSFQRNAYPPRPPHSATSSQFSYGPSIQHMKSRRDCPPPYSSRFHHAPRMQGGNYYNNHERMRPDPYEFRDEWIYPPPSFSGPRYPDKGRGSYGHSAYDTHPCERYPNHGWGYPRGGNHRNSFHERPHEAAVPVGLRGPSYWRPR